MIFVVLAEICRCRAEIFVVPEDIGNMPRLLLLLRVLYRKYADIFVDMKYAEIFIVFEDIGNMSRYFFCI